MKVLIYVHKRDVISGNITDYYINSRPQTSNWTEYVQIEITRDEFVRLEDNKADNRDKDQWNIDQFNRNREFDQQIDSIDDIIADQDNQPFAD